MTFALASGVVFAGSKVALSDFRLSCERLCVGVRRRRRGRGHTLDGRDDISEATRASWIADVAGATARGDVFANPFYR
jgi:hypothetical protein